MNTQEGHLLLTVQELNLYKHAAEESLSWVWSVLYTITLSGRLLWRLLFYVNGPGCKANNDSLIPLQATDLAT